MPLDAGIERVRSAAIGGRAADAEQLVEHVIDEIIGAGARDDDVALVAVRRLGPQLRRTFTAEPSAVSAQARHEVTSFAHAHGYAQEMLGDLALAVSEACTERGGARVPRSPGARPDAHRRAHRRRRARGDRGRRGRGVRPRGDSPGVGLGLRSWPAPPSPARSATRRAAAPPSSCASPTRSRACPRASRCERSRPRPRPRRAGGGPGHHPGHSHGVSADADTGS